MTQYAQLKSQIKENHDDLKSSIESLRLAMEAQSTELNQMRKALVEKDKKIEELQDTVRKLSNRVDVECVEREIRDRIDCVRIFNLPVDGDNQDVGNVLGNVHSKLLKPILSMAVEAGKLQNVPTVDELLAYGHILPTPRSRKQPVPAATSEQLPPIIVRFRRRLYRDLVLMYKKEFFAGLRTRSRSLAVPQPGSAGAAPVFITEDLPAPVYKRLMQLRDDERIARAWTFKCRIHYVTVDDDKTRKMLRSPFDALK